MNVLEDAASPWYAIRVRSNFEQKTSKLLRQKGFEELLPTYKCKKIWSDRVKIIDQPLFPGYVFCRFDQRNLLKILQTAGVVHVVSFAGEPTPVDEREMDSVRTLMNSSIPLAPHPFLRVGERVLIKRGPLAGVEGILLRFQKDYRLIVSVSLLQRSVAAEVESDWVSQISNSPV